jgi:hypothetical protein
MPDKDLELPLPSATELNRIARFGGEVEHLSGISRDTWERNFPELIVHLSSRATGVRVGHALKIGTKHRKR